MGFATYISAAFTVSSQLHKVLLLVQPTRLGWVCRFRPAGQALHDDFLATAATYGQCKHGRDDVCNQHIVPLDRCVDHGDEDCADNCQATVASRRQPPGDRVSEEHSRAQAALRQDKRHTQQHKTNTIRCCMIVQRLRSSECESHGMATTAVAAVAHSPAPPVSTDRRCCSTGLHP